MSNQSGIQTAIRASTGTTGTYNEDWHALWDDAAIAAGTFNERMLAWINAQLSASYTNIADAMQAFAVDQGFANWSSMNTLELFTPLSLSPVLWLDFADRSTLFQDTAGTTPVTTSGQTVARVNDKSGNGNYFVQATTSKMPAYTTTDYVHALFDGIDDAMASNSAVNLTATDKLTVFATIERTTTATSSAMVLEHSANAGSNLGTFYQIAVNAAATLSTVRTASSRGGAGVLLAGHGSEVTGRPSSGSKEVLTALHDISGDSTIQRVNGTAGAAGTADKGISNFTSQTMYLSARGGTSLYFAGKITDVVIYAGLLSAGNIALVEEYLAAKNGATLA